MTESEVSAAGTANVDPVQNGGARFFVEPKVNTVRGQQITRWELSRQQSDEQQSAVAIGNYPSKSAAINAATLKYQIPHEGDCS